MITYADRIKTLQQHGVLLHRSTDWGNQLGAYCTQTGWKFFEDSKEFVLKQLKDYSIPVIYEYEGPAWENPLPSWPQVSFERAQVLRAEYNRKWVGR